MKSNKPQSGKNGLIIGGVLLLVALLIFVTPYLPLMSVIRTDTTTNTGYLSINTNVCDVQMYAYNSAGNTIVNGENLDCTITVPSTGMYRSLAWLPPSTYKIVLVKSGYTNAEFSGVIIQTGGTTTLNNNPITMVAGVSVVPTPLPTPPPILNGKLIVTSVPTSATVYIDGFPKGNTPYEVTLPIATYTIKVEKSGYQSLSKTVTLSSTETRFDATLVSTTTPTTPSTTSVLIEVWHGYEMWGVPGQYDTFYVKGIPSLAGKMFHEIIEARTAIDDAIASTVTTTPAPTVTIPAPSGTQPTLSIPSIISSIWNWIKGILGLASITGGETISVGAGQQSYIIAVTSPEAPDSVYTDKTYSELYGTWFVVDSNQNIIAQKGGWDKVSSTIYTDSVLVTFPNIGTYSVVGVIVKIPYTYGTSWVKGTETIIAKEQMKISVVMPTPPTSQPLMNISGIISLILNWIKSLFGM